MDGEAFNFGSFEHAEVYAECLDEGKIERGWLLSR